MTSAPHSEKAQPQHALLAGVWAVSIVFTLIVIKAFAYWKSDSAAMLSTLTDSLMDGLVSIMILLAVRLSMKPADRDHRYGHGKVEGIAGMIQSALMSAAGCYLIFIATKRFFYPQDVTDHFIGIGVSSIAILLSAALIIIQARALKKAPSLALESDHAHYKTDIVLNMSVIFALIADYKGWPVGIDSSVAFFAGIYFIGTGIYIGRKAADMLMDRELPQELREKIRGIAREHPAVKGIHDVRTRQMGMNIHISMDIEMDPDLRLSVAHAYAYEVELAILRNFPNAEVMIHMDPYGLPDHDGRHHRIS